MEIVLIGHGKMGKAIEEAAKHRGHEIVAICRDRESLLKIAGDAYICIDFTSPQAFAENYMLIVERFKSAVVGTTGWDKIEKKVFDYFALKNKTLIYASNFSLGVNIFSHLVAMTSKLLVGLGDYDPYLIEMHHRQKKDAPSGTAKMLDRFIKTAFGKSANPVSVRSGHIRGVHEVGYESEVDRIILKHEAYSRKGFVEGALLAAESIGSVSGICNFKDLLQSKFKDLLT